MSRILELVLNGRRRVDAVPDNLLLLDYLREVVGLTGTKTGCDGGECGACTVLIDDQPRLSCLTLAAGVNGQRVDTVEALGHDGRLSAVQRQMLLPSAARMSSSLGCGLRRSKPADAMMNPGVQ